MNINFLMIEASTLDYITTQTEDEALMLENKTIKLRQPKYNVLLKDDKTYSSLRLEINETYPRISIVRKCSDKDSLYLGPFKSSENLRKTKDFFKKHLVLGIVQIINLIIIKRELACLKI